MIVTNPDFPLTSEYHIKAKSGDPHSPLLIFIPGNPGLIDYYTTYLDLVHEKYPEYDILAVSHAGFQTSGDYSTDSVKNGQDFYNLEYQVKHKCAIIKRHVMQGHTKVSFLCHSVGGYVTQRVVKELQQDEDIKDCIEIQFVGLICPTIVDIAKSDSGVFFTALFSYLPVVQLAVFLLVFLRLILSDSWAKSIIRKFIIARPASNDEKLLEAWENAITATFKIYKSKSIARQALMLAREELQVIHRDDAMNDWFFETLPNTQNIRIWCFFAEKDYWVHDNTRDYILARYHDQESKFMTFEIGEPTNEGSRAITHSFCIDQSVEFAQITCDALQH